MQDIVTTLTHKEQTVLGAICLGRIAAPGTRLAAVVGIDFHGHALMQQGFVGDVTMQFSEGPRGRMPIGLTLFLTRLLPTPALGTFTDMGQVLQTDETVWVLGNNAMTDLVVGISFQPSLPSAHHHQAAGSGTGAFLL
jgi:hypothetical protein